jgi:trimeric autotransporter adhesin
MTVVQGALDFGTSGGTSTLSGASQQVAGGSSTVMGGSSARQVVMDGNGKMTVINGVAQEASTSMHITNGYGTTNGVMANEHTAAISGGTVNPTTMALTDSGAHFSNSRGDPVIVSGVADGQGAFDAANIRQLDGSVASIAALAGIPSPTAGKDNSVGIGMGQHGSGMAMAVGGQSLVGDSLTIKYGASVSYSGGLFDSSTMLGVGMSW